MDNSESKPNPVMRPPLLHADCVRLTKQWRRDLDAVLQQIKDGHGSREVSLAVTKTQEAIMWLGMDLKRLGDVNPYPESMNPDSPRIEPPADGLKM